MSHSASQAVAQHDDDDDYEDEMFKTESKDDDSCMGGSSTMFSDEDNTTRSFPRPVVAPARPTSLKAAHSLVSPTNSGHDSLSNAHIKSDTRTTSTSFNSPSSPFDSLRTWSSSALLYARQYVSEHLSRGNGTTTAGDPETVARVSALREQQRYYARLLRMATTLTGQLEQMVRTQRALGGAFGELSQGGGDVALGEQFACSTDVMRLMSKHGDALLASLSVFRQTMSTLCNTTIEDTLTTVKNCDNARIKYSAYRSRVDSLRAAQSSSRDTSLHVRLQEAERALELHKQKYDRVHNDLIIKLKFLEENKVTVCQKHLYLLNKAFTAYVSGNLQGVDDILKHCHLSEPVSGSHCERLPVKPVATNG